MKRLLVCVLLVGVVAYGEEAVPAADELAGKIVDTRTLHHKVLCGYQGWFRCPVTNRDRDGNTGAGTRELSTRHP